MRLLCDHHVPPRFRTAFADEPWLDAVTVADALGGDADDTEIATFAAETNRIVFTNDDDFFQHPGDYGLILYEQRQRPSASAVVTALQAIAAAYDDHATIVEYVPDGWV